MKTPLLIDQALLDSVSLEAGRNPRQRKNRNFHADDTAPAHRLLNAIEPGSYLMPHRHLDANKDETMIVLRGRMGVIFFDDLEENIAAARSIGWTAHQIDHTRDTAAQMRYHLTRWGLNL